MRGGSSIWTHASVSVRTTLPVLKDRVEILTPVNANVPPDHPRSSGTMSLANAGEIITRYSISFPADASVPNSSPVHEENVGTVLCASVSVDHSNTAAHTGKPTAPHLVLASALDHAVTMRLWIKGLVGASGDILPPVHP